MEAEEAWPALVEHLEALCPWMSRQDAEDAAQDAILRAWFRRLGVLAAKIDDLARESADSGG